MTGFNADEVFAIAEEIERNGAAYYRRAAMKTEDVGMKDLLTQLSEWEVRHEETFGKIRARLKNFDNEREQWNFSEDSEKYLQAVADGKVFIQDNDAEIILEQSKSMTDILRFAAEREKDSIVFYAALSEGAVSDEDKHRISRIMKEEIGHLGILSEKMALISDDK